MEHTDRYLASLSDEGRYRLLIEAITDYAINIIEVRAFLEWEGKPDKLQYFSPNPGAGD
jgi:hypothetical protein